MCWGFDMSFLVYIRIWRWFRCIAKLRDGKFGARLRNLIQLQAFATIAV